MDELLLFQVDQVESARFLVKWTIVSEQEGKQ